MMLPRRYLPPIPALMALEAVDRLGTASAAAAELALTQGAISRALTLLSMSSRRACRSFPYRSAFTSQR